MSESYEEKYQRQLELEDESVSLGVTKYREAVEKGDLTDTQPGIVLLKRSIGPLVEAINEFKKPSRGGGKLQQTKRLIKLIDSYELAFLTARKVIDSITQAHENMLTCATSLGLNIQWHYNYVRLKEKYPGYARTLDKNLTSSHDRHRTKVLGHSIKYLEDIERVEWTDDERLHLGLKMIDLFIESTGLVEKVLGGGGDGKRDFYYLKGTSEVMEWIDKQNARCELMYPVFLPMIVKPKPWTSLFNGGYLNNEILKKTCLIKTRDKDVLRELENHEMPNVLKAINSVQETAWRINTKVLEVLKEAKRIDSGIAGLPQDPDKYVFPPKPWSSDDEFDYMKENYPEVVKGWKRKVRDTHRQIHRSVGIRTQLASKITMADRLKDEEEIFFVWTIDYRGRMYPLTPFLNPQGDDVAKSLLTFAHGKPLGSSGARWLRIHLANEFGVDKVPFEDRIQWVKDNEELILDSARDPLGGQRFWEEADKPWCFLAACFEYAGYKEQGESYVSSLPIAMDGTCNGLQNFAAMLRDPIGGKAVNLLPSDKPQDVYQEVCDVVNGFLKRDLENGIDLAGLWMDGKVDRGMVKRNVMTTPYGVTPSGMLRQLIEEVDKRYQDGDETYYIDPDIRWRAAQYLATRIHEAVGEVVVGARKAMDWLQEIALLAAERNLGLTWITPTGMKAVQICREERVKKVNTFFGGVRCRLNVNEYGEKIDKGNQRNGIAPNFVHSMDASHLMRTVNMAVEEGIKSFSLIHDSYGTLAADTDKLARILREAFVSMYEEHDVLQEFYEQVKSQLPFDMRDSLPKPPEKGSLDLALVLESLFFFA